MRLSIFMNTLCNKGTSIIPLIWMQSKNDWLDPSVTEKSSVNLENLTTGSTNQVSIRIPTMDLQPRRASSPESVAPMNLSLHLPTPPTSDTQLTQNLSSLSNSETTMPSTSKFQCSTQIPSV